MIKVSVIIPTYNRRDYLKEALDSVLWQSFRDFEIIVIDDGSNDGTREMIQEVYGSSIKYIWQENQGESVARNRGLEAAQGEYIALLDSDDRWLKEKLTKQVKYLNENPIPGMVYSQAWIIDGTGKRIEGDPWGIELYNDGIDLESLVFNNRISGPSSTLIRRSVINKVGEFDSNIRYGEDWDLWLRIAKHFGIALIEEPMVEVRRHRNSQCYFPSRDINKFRLVDHLSIIEKAISSWPNSSTERLKERAFAHQYSQAFLAEAAVGNFQSAKENLQTTFELAPEALHDTNSFGRFIVNNGAIIAQEAGTGDFRPTIIFVNWVLNELESVGIKDNYFYKSVWAEVYAMLGFLSYKNDNIPQARNFFLNSIWYNPRFLGNLGIISVLVQSVFGTKNYVRIRTSVTYLKEFMD
jgi:glycosyltransferase involved in cell wall biosynthesis